MWYPITSVTPSYIKSRVVLSGLGALPCFCSTACSGCVCLRVELWGTPAAQVAQERSADQEDNQALGTGLCWWPAVRPANGLFQSFFFSVKDTWDGGDGSVCLDTGLDQKQAVCLPTFSPDWWGLRGDDQADASSAISDKLPTHLRVVPIII